MVDRGAAPEDDDDNMIEELDGVAVGATGAGPATVDVTCITTGVPFSLLEADWTTSDVTNAVDAATETVVGGMVVEGVVTTIGVVETGAEELGGVKVENDVVVSITVVGPMTVGGGDEVVGSVVTGVKLVTVDAVAIPDQHIE